MARGEYVDLYRDAAGAWRWRYRRNGRTMADSGQGYSRRIDCGRAMATVLNLRWDPLAPDHAHRLSVSWDGETRVSRIPVRVEP